MERDRLAGRVIALHPGSGLLSTRCGRVLRFSRAELLLSTFDSEIQAGSPVSFEVEPSHGMPSAVRVSRATAFEFEVGRRFITRYHDAPLGDPDLLPVSSSLCRLVSRSNDSRAAAEHELENLVRRAGGNLLIHCSEQRSTHGVQVSATAGLYLQRHPSASPAVGGDEAAENAGVEFRHRLQLLLAPRQPLTSTASASGDSRCRYLGAYLAIGLSVLACVFIWC